MDLQLTLRDVFISAMAALLITWLVINIWSFIKKTFTRPVELGFKARSMAKIMERCYLLFPREIVQFHGVTFHRGMIVRVVTDKQKVFEGRLIGLSNDNMLCVLTNRYIVAQELHKVNEMNICETAKEITQ